MKSAIEALKNAIEALDEQIETRQMFLGKSLKYASIYKPELESFAIKRAEHIEAILHLGGTHPDKPDRVDTEMEAAKVDDVAEKPPEPVIEQGE